MKPVNCLAYNEILKTTMKRKLPLQTKLMVIFLSLPFFAACCALCLFLHRSLLVSEALHRPGKQKIGQLYREQVQNTMTNRILWSEGHQKRYQKKNRSPINGHNWGWYDGGERGNIIWFKENDKYWERKADDLPRSTTDYSEYRELFALVILLMIALGISTFASIRYMVKSMKEKDDFIAAAIHDLSTPLMALKIMASRKNDAQIKNITERLTRILANLRDFLLQDGKRQNPSPVKCDLKKLCEEAYELFKDDFRDLMNGEDVKLAVEGSALAMADETLVMQILWNLYGNELKYGAPYDKVTVKIAPSDDMRHIAVEFADYGAGMTKKEMRLAFNRYYRAKTVMKSGKGGFGIGLCTSRNFARQMGGDIIVRENRPRGCIFTLLLPIAQPESRQT